MFQVTIKKQKKALNNVSSCNKEATSTLLKNFYGNDVVRSLPSVRDAITLFQQVRNLCKRGGFKLTKCISNKDIKFLMRLEGMAQKTRI